MFNKFESLPYDARNRVMGPSYRMVGIPAKTGTKQVEKSKELKSAPMKNSKKKY